MLKKEPCAYCGKVAEDTTKGHVISRSLYPDSLPNIQRITVPECPECKLIWERAESSFRNIMIAIWNPEQIEKDNRYEKMMRSFRKSDGHSRFRHFMNCLVSESSSDGERDLIYPIKDPEFNLILRRIIRGLCHYHKIGTAIADDRVFCHIMQFQIPESFKFDFCWHEISPGFCCYAYAIINDNNLHSFWLIRFSQHIEFFATISVDKSIFLPIQESRVE